VNWIYSFTPEQIGSQSTITELRPFRKLAEVVTELQQKVVASVEVTMTEEETPSASIVDNVLRISIPVSAFKEYVNSLLPDGGEDGDVLQRNSSGEAYWGPVRAK